MMRLPYEPIWLRRFVLTALLCTPLLACKMTKDNPLPNSQDLPLFNPHRPDFICAVETDKVPTIDAQADAWFLEARALEDPSIYEDDRDFKKIVQLTRLAADRHHWKAMLNLASLYLENRDPPHGAQDALQLVQEAMRLGIPAAYDRMGTYYMNGTGVNGDITKAYAYFQKAAEMGNPQAMTFLGEKLTATWDSPKDGFWANIPVARKMLECAFGQGYGPAADRLATEYQDLLHSPTLENNVRALKTLHEGVKLGCAECANTLCIEFDHPFDPARMLPLSLDKTRSERYAIIADALSFNPDRRFPNLDKILPLPPAKLPSWNGDKKTLIDAAKGVTSPPPTPKPSAATQYKGRHFVAAEFTLRPAGVITAELHAPAPAYWQPTARGQDAAIQSLLAAVPPGLYLMDEPFERFYQANDGRRPVEDVVWERWDTIRHNHSEVDPQAAFELTRVVPRPEPFLSCTKAVCPATGVWQPWVQPDHALSDIVNRHWRQVWLTAGQAFPQLDRDWPFDLGTEELTWHLMDEVGVDIG